MAGARTHAVAAGTKILTLCDGCTLSLSEAREAIAGNEEAEIIVNELGLNVNASKIVGILEYLHSNLDKIKKKLVTKIDFKLAVFPGCHCEAACKMNGTSAKDMMSDIIRTLGGTPVHVDENLCCGGGLAAVDTELEHKVMNEATSSIKATGAIAVMTSCPFCFLQFDLVGRMTTLHVTELVASGMGWQENAHRHHRTK
jgi:heterodisulfide reductase subunit B